MVLRRFALLPSSRNTTVKIHNANCSPQTQQELQNKDEYICDDDAMSKAKFLFLLQIVMSLLLAAHYKLPKNQYFNKDEKKSLVVLHFNFCPRWIWLRAFLGSVCCSVHSTFLHSAPQFPKQHCFLKVPTWTVCPVNNSKQMDVYGALVNIPTR